MNTYTVTFNANGHGDPAPAPLKDVNHGSKITAPAMADTADYHFSGWFKDPACTMVWDFANDTVTKDTTLYAGWGLNTYTVSFNANGGSGTMGSQTFTAGAAQKLAAKKFSKIGFTFLEWNTAADGSGASYADGAVITAVKDMVLYAQWKSNPPVIVQQPAAQTVQEGQQAVFSVKAAGSGLRWQWYINRNDGKGWVKLEGAVSAAYTTSAAAPDNNGYQYACQISDPYGNKVQTAPAVLYVTALPALPQTGDSSAPALWLALLALSTLGLTLLRRKERI